jgi:hypothetical protein
MPIPVPPADLQATISRRGHLRLEEDPDTPADYDIEKRGALLDDDIAQAPQAKNAYGDRYVDSDAVRARTGWRGRWRRIMAVLVKHGVESRGIEPVPEEVSVLLFSVSQGFPQY